MGQEDGDAWGALMAQLVAHRHLDRTKALGEIEKQLSLGADASAAPWAADKGRVEADLLSVVVGGANADVPWEAVQGAFAASESWVRHGCASESFMDQLL